MTIRLAGPAASLEAQSTITDLGAAIAAVGLTADLFADVAVAGLVLVPAAAAAVADSVSSNGADAMDVPAAVSSLDVTGAGIRIGILSDSFDSQGTADLHAEEADGDLPATIDILSDYKGGSDEGRAMAEVVHAVAPGAAIDFATANSTDQDFADGILALAAAGCNIIVDDITYFDEPFFEDSNVIQQAVETVIAEGVSYFTAASNEGTNYYQSAVAIDTTATLLLDGTTTVLGLEDFGAAAAADSGSDDVQDIVIDAGMTVSFDLQWTQPFETNGAGVTISPGSDYSLAMYLFSGTSLEASVTDDVKGGDPVQVLSFDPKTTGTYELEIALTDGTVPAGDTLKYLVYESYTTAGSVLTIEDSDADTGSGDITGHELVGLANTVGAVNADTPSTTESYSSSGPGTLDTYSATGTLTGSTVENKVNVLAPDGIDTSVGGFSQFFGTSAAAPDAAAVAALLLQANPNLTPAQVTAALESTATAVSGSTNEVGSGLVNADAAVSAVDGDQWTTAAGGDWETGADWSATVAPGTADPATLSNDDGTLTAAYGVTVTGTGDVADTLTVGDATTASDPDVTLTVAAGEKLAVVTGATVTQDGTLIVAGGGTLTVGQLAELTDATAVLTLQAHATVVAGAVEIGTGTIGIGTGATLTADGSVDIEIELVGNSATTYETVPYGLATGGGTLTVSSGGLLQLTGLGGVLLGGGLVVDAGGTLADGNTGAVAFLVLGGTLTDDGKVTEADGLLVNNNASVTVGAGGVLTAGSVDVEGTAASLRVAGMLTDSGALSGASPGHATVAQGGTLSIGAGEAGVGVSIDHGGRLTLATTTASILTAGLTGTVTLAGGLAQIDFAGLPYASSDTLAVHAGTLEVTSGSTVLAELPIHNTAGKTLEPLGHDAGGGTLITVACFRHGTLIATPTGEVPVEGLRIGDPVLTAGGKVRPVHWLGRRAYAAEQVARERLVQPIRIRAGALGPSRPRHDLDLSAQHAVLLDDVEGPVLVPAGLLANGVSIVRPPVDGPVAYVHIELRAHDAVLAEGQAAETFADHGSRKTFDNAADYAELYPGEKPRPAHAPAPRIEGGAALARIRGGIEARAGLRPGALRSAVDRVDARGIGGWAHDADNPACPVLLEILADGVVIGTTLADRYRPDLAALGRADGYCGFSFALPESVDAQRRHIVSVRRAADGAALRGVPALLDRADSPATLVRGLLADRSADPAQTAAFLAAQIAALRRPEARNQKS